MDKSVVRVIATGGTIDSESETSDTEKSVFAGTHIPEMLRVSRITSDVIFESLMMKDSLDLTDDDRGLIFEHCLSCPEKQIVITHGTHTMIDTAKVLGTNILDKTIVLVGAFTPYIKEGSDAVSNLKYAIEQARQLPPGAYIAMNGRVFPWDNVRKNKEKQVFENLKKTVK